MRCARPSKINQTKALRIEDKRALIVQAEIPHYRRPFFCALAEGTGLDVTVLHSGRPPGVRHCGFSEIIVSTHQVGSIRWQSGVLRHAEEHDVLVSMFDLHWPGNVLPAILPRLARPVVFWGHGYGRRKSVAALRTVLAKRADAIVCYSSGGRDAYIRRGIDPAKVFVAPNTLLVSNASLGSGESRKSFTFVGRLSKRKRVHELIEAFALADRRLPPSMGIEIVGDGPMREPLERLAHNLGVRNRVFFWGNTTDEVFLRDLFHRSLAYVCPGWVGLGVLHSFAYGVPVVTSLDVCHAPESENLEEGVNSILFTGGHEALADKLVSLAADPAYAHRLGSNGYNHYRRKRSIRHAVAGFRAALDYALARR